MSPGRNAPKVRGVCFDYGDLFFFASCANYTPAESISEVLHWRAFLLRVVNRFAGGLGVYSCLRSQALNVMWQVKCALTEGAFHLF